MTKLFLNQELTGLDGEVLENKTVVETAKEFYENMKVNMDKAIKENPNAKHIDISFLMNQINIGVEKTVTGLTIREAIKRAIKKAPVEKSDTETYLLLWTISQKIAKGFDVYDLDEDDQKALVFHIINHVPDNDVQREAKITLTAILKGKIKSVNPAAPEKLELTNSDNGNKTDKELVESK